MVDFRLGQSEGEGIEVEDCTKILNFLRWGEIGILGVD